MLKIIAPTPYHVLDYDSTLETSIASVICPMVDQQQEAMETPKPARDGKPDSNDSPDHTPTESTQPSIPKPIDDPNSGYSTPPPQTEHPAQQSGSSTPRATRLCPKSPSVEAQAQDEPSEPSANSPETQNAPLEEEPQEPEYRRVHHDLYDRVLHLSQVRPPAFYRGYSDFGGLPTGPPSWVGISDEVF